MRFSFLALRLFVLSLMLAGSLAPALAASCILFTPNPPDATHPVEWCDADLQQCHDSCISERDLCILEPFPGGDYCISSSQTANLGAFTAYVNNGFWTWAFGVAIGGAVFAGVVGGLKIVLSNGDSAQIEAGKNQFFWAAMGLIVLLLSGVILEYINPFGFKNL